MGRVQEGETAIKILGRVQEGETAIKILGRVQEGETAIKILGRAPGETAIKYFREGTERRQQLILGEGTGSVQGVCPLFSNHKEKDRGVTG